MPSHTENTNAKNAGLEGKLFDILVKCFQSNLI